MPSAKIVAQNPLGSFSPVLSVGHPCPLCAPAGVALLLAAAAFDRFSADVTTIPATIAITNKTITILYAPDANMKSSGEFREPNLENKVEEESRAVPPL